MNIRKIRIPLFCIRSTGKCTQILDKTICSRLTNANANLQTQTLTSAFELGVLKSFSQVTPISVPIYMDSYNFSTKPQTQTTEKWTGSTKNTPRTQNQTGQQKSHPKVLPSSKNQYTKTGGKKMRAGTCCVCVQKRQKNAINESKIIMVIKVRRFVPCFLLLHSTAEH